MSSIDAEALRGKLDSDGFAILPALLDPDNCEALRSLYADERHFRSRVIMQRHHFGRGEYQYLRYPLPSHVSTLRGRLYAVLAPIANDWAHALGEERKSPPQHQDYLQNCHAAGQARPTPLILKYGAGDYNCLHQDLYGEQVFPLQAVIMLSSPGDDFQGGELVLVEQRPRAQSRPQVIRMNQGDAVIFAVNQRPKQGVRGTYRVRMKHGVSRVEAGERYTLGIIFHDAQ